MATDDRLGSSDPAFEAEKPTVQAPAPSPADPMIGQKIGRYTIKSVIGSGGMGTVYLAV